MHPEVTISSDSEDSDIEEIGKHLTLCCKFLFCLNLYILIFNNGKLISYLNTLRPKNLICRSISLHFSPSVLFFFLHQNASLGLKVPWLPDWVYNICTMCIHMVISCLPLPPHRKYVRISRAPCKRIQKQYCSIFDPPPPKKKRASPRLTGTYSFPVFHFA